MSTSTLPALASPRLEPTPVYLEATTWLAGCSAGCNEGWLLTNRGEWDECACHPDPAEAPVEEPPIADPLAA